MVNLYPDKAKGQWPDFFDQKSIVLTENNSKEKYTSTLTVGPIDKAILKLDIPIEKIDGSSNKINRKNTYVMYIPHHMLFVKNKCFRVENRLPNLLG